MSPANKFWLGVLGIFLFIIFIKEPTIFFIVFISYLIVNTVAYLSINTELEYVLEEQKKYKEEQKKEKDSRWFTNYYEDQTEKIEKYTFYLRLIFIYWVITAFKSFNNFLNNKFSKNG